MEKPQFSEDGSSFSMPQALYFSNMTTPDKLPLIPHKPRNRQKFLLVIHGGAGTMSRTSATPERQSLYRTALKAALTAGYAILHEGGEAIDAAVAAVTVLEGGCS